MTWATRLHGSMNYNEEQRSPAILVTVAEAACRISMGRTWVYERVLSGEIPSVKLGRSRRISVAVLEEYVRRLSEGA